MFLLEPDKEIQTGGCWKGTLFLILFRGWVWDGSALRRIRDGTGSVQGR